MVLYTGATVEEAIQKGLNDLDIPRMKAHITVVAREKKGFLGLFGKKPAQVEIEPIAETTVISAPATNPRFARNRLVSSFPPILLISFTSPIFAIVKGIIPTSCSFAYLEF